MSVHADDTDLDALSAQVRAYPQLTAKDLGELLAQARSAPHEAAERSIVEHHLVCALDAALARRNQGLDIDDLYQEATVAVVLAVSNFIKHEEPAGKLLSTIRRTIDEHLDSALAEEKAEREREEGFVRDAQLLSMTRIHLRSENGHEPTAFELAAALQWEPARVRLVTEIVDEAQALYDTDILEYLDDESNTG